MIMNSQARRCYPKAELLEVSGGHVWVNQDAEYCILDHVEVAGSMDWIEPKIHAFKFKVQESRVT